MLTCYLSVHNLISSKLFLVASSESFYPDDRPITGFGAALTDASAYLLRQMPEAVRKDVLNRLFAAPEAGGMGLNYVRVTCSASDFSLRFYTYDDMPPGQTDPNLNNFKVLKLYSSVCAQ